MLNGHFHIIISHSYIPIEALNVRHFYLVFKGSHRVVFNDLSLLTCAHSSAVAIHESKCFLVPIFVVIILIRGWGNIQISWNDAVGIRDFSVGFCFCNSLSILCSYRFLYLV